MAAQEVQYRKRPAASWNEEARVALEQDRTETALAQTRQASMAEPENTELTATALGKEGAERRVSFILRVTVDEQGQPRRAEVEHARSGNKEAYPGLDLQRLVAFVEVCINLPNHPETDDPPGTPTDS